MDCTYQDWLQSPCRRASSCAIQGWPIVSQVTWAQTSLLCAYWTCHRNIICCETTLDFSSGVEDSYYILAYLILSYRLRADMSRAVICSLGSLFSFCRLVTSSVVQSHSVTNSFTGDLSLMVDPCSVDVHCNIILAWALNLSVSLQLHYQ
jgi:hypothetical protein